MKHLEGRTRVDLREHPELRHHEDRIDRQPRDPFGIEPVQQQHRGLVPARRVGEHSARADEQVQLHHLDQRRRHRLLEGVGDRPLPLHPFQLRRELLVLLEGQPQCLARDGMLDLKLLERLRDRRRPDHLVLDAVPEVALVDGEGNPALELLEVGCLIPSLRDVVEFGKPLVRGDRLGGVP